MLGISIPDVIAIVTLFSGLLLAYYGSKRGSADRKVDPPDPPAAILGGALVDTRWAKELALGSQDQAAATRELVAVLKEGIEQQKQSREDKVQDMLEEIIERLPEEKKPARRST